MPSSFSFFSRIAARAFHGILAHTPLLWDYWGVIDDDGPWSFFVIFSSNSSSFGIKGLLYPGRSRTTLSVIIPHIAVVLHKVRGEYDHLVSRV